jgi:hypothetical protein
MFIPHSWRKLRIVGGIFDRNFMVKTDFYILLGNTSRTEDKDRVV